MSQFEIGDCVVVMESPTSRVKVGAVLEVVDFVSDRDWISDSTVEQGCMNRYPDGPWKFEKVVKVPSQPAVGNTKYNREIKPGVFVDVYDVLYAFKVTDPCLQHAVKKALAAGQRGHKDLRQDLVDIRDSAQRALDSYDIWTHNA